MSVPLEEQRRLAAKLVRDAALDHEAAEAAPGRSPHRWPAALPPREAEPLPVRAVLHPGLNGHAPVGHRQSTVLDGVGDELVHRAAQRLRGLAAQAAVLAGDGEPVPPAAAEVGLELLAQQPVQARPPPLLLREQLVRPAEAAQPVEEILDVGVDGAGAGLRQLDGNRRLTGTLRVG
jgi:hypothetical protein